jgi:hypothetical protein
MIYSFFKLFIQDKEFRKGTLFLLSAMVFSFSIVHFERYLTALELFSIIGVFGVFWSVVYFFKGFQRGDDL